MKNEVELPTNFNCIILFWAIILTTCTAFGGVHGF